MELSFSLHDMLVPISSSGHSSRKEYNLSETHTDWGLFTATGGCLHHAVVWYDDHDLRGFGLLPTPRTSSHD